jgi:outer membrane protein OmpA-like peptidoglycan-associated protein
LLTCLAGCASTPAPPDPALTVTIRHAPAVVADLGFVDFPPKSGPVSWSGGFEHALVVPGPRVRPADSAASRPRREARESVHFPSGRVGLDPAERGRLDALVGHLGAANIGSVAIEGHTDSVGSADDNRRLSERRAAEVRDYLRSLGVPGDRMTGLGLGESAPLATNATAAGRAANRRAEIDAAAQ